MCATSAQASSFDDRTLAQITADVFADLLLAGTPGGDGLSAIHATVQVTIPVTSLAGASEAGAMLAGVGAVDADTVRALAGVAPGWNRVITDPVTGIIHTVDRYRPSTEIRRLLRTRDEHCRFPGCRRPAHRTDLDHTHDHAHGGDTAIDNLAHLCRRHHTLKHHTRWQVRSRGNGVLEWTSPLGEIYTDTPPGQVSAAPPPPRATSRASEPVAPF